jgi:tetratricopeptide (TPR) repeat protein
MPDTSSPSEHVNDVDTALLDADLFIKYKAPERAVKRLRTALETNPRSIALREKLREICIAEKQKDEGARQCLALASLYIEREDFESAYDRLLEAKQLDARINIASGLEAIRRARRPDLRPDQGSTSAPAPGRAQHSTLAGDLAAISIFDAIQVVENAKLTGTLLLTPDLNSSAQTGRVLFNEGRIVDAEAAGDTAEQGFRRIVEITKGSFEFHRSTKTFPRRIDALSNTNLILDTLSQLDEEKR